MSAKSALLAPERAQQSVYHQFVSKPRPQAKFATKRANALKFLHSLGGKRSVDDAALRGQDRARAAFTMLRLSWPKVVGHCCRAEVTGGGSVKRRYIFILIALEAPPCHANQRRINLRDSGFASERCRGRPQSREITQRAGARWARCSGDAFVHVAEESRARLERLDDR